MTICTLLRFNTYIQAIMIHRDRYDNFASNQLTSTPCTLARSSKERKAQSKQKIYYIIILKYAFLTQLH